MSPKTISVAMATFNGLPFIREQLESIRAQSLPPSEIVICDDGSTDGTWEYLRELASRDARIVVHRNAARLGSTKNFERAIGQCTGGIIFLSDQDDVWQPDKVESMVAAARAHAAALVMSNGRLIDAHGKDLGLSVWEVHGLDARVVQRLQSTSAFASLAKAFYITGSALCFDGSLRDLLLPIPAGFLHDQWLGLVAALARPGAIVLIDRPLYGYRQHERNEIGAPLARYKVDAQLAKGIRLALEEIRSHDDLLSQLRARSRTLDGLAGQPIGALPGVRPVLLEERKRVAFLSWRCSYIEGHVPMSDAFRQWSQYRAEARGLRTLTRDVLARTVYGLGLAKHA